MRAQHLLPRVEAKDLSQPAARRPTKRDRKFRPDGGHQHHDVVALALEVIAAGSWRGIGEANGYANMHTFKRSILYSSRVAIALSPQQIAALERIR